MRRHLALILAAGFLVACSGSGGKGGAPDESPLEDDWSLPAYATVATNSGFFSEQLAPASNVNVRVVDVTWRQLKPSAMTFDTSATATLGQDYALQFASLHDQLASPDPYWLRVWISTEDAVPQWVLDACPTAKLYGPGYENDRNVGIWNACVWGHALDLYRELLETHGLRNDPRLVMAYVPGAFTYAEFDYDIVNDAVAKGDLDFPVFRAWFEGAMQSLVDVMNGENADPADDAAQRLVFTGEDYPFGPESWGTQDDLLARDAVAKGMGIRTGITEVFDFHLAQVPAYGTTIAPDGHLVTDESAPAFSPGRIRATENECYRDCGFSTAALYYAVKMSNLKTLQLRMNWDYVVPSTSYLAEYADLWNWVRLELGHTVYDSPDAWVALRDAQDTYWEGNDPALVCGSTGFAWSTCPYVRNFERWIVQKDVAAGGVPKRGSEERRGVVDAANGIAYEGLSTDAAGGMDSLYFDVDDRFLLASAEPVDLKVTWRDAGSASWTVDYASTSGTSSTAPTTNAATGAWKTTTFHLTDATFDGSMPGGSDFRIHATGGDVEARFVRLVKLVAP